MQDIKDYGERALQYMPEPAPQKAAAALKKKTKEEGCLSTCFQMFGMGRKGPWYNSWKESKKDRGQHPLICVAGLASGSLQHQTHCCSCCHSCCLPCCKAHTKVSYCSISALATNPLGTLRSLRLEAVRGKRKDGAEAWTTRSLDKTTKPVDGTAGIRTLNPGEHIPVSVWDTFIDDLEDKFNCHAFNFDWRRWGDIVYAETLVDKFRDNVQDAIEHAQESKKKATVVGHSMGAPVILYVLTKLGKAWTQKYIEKVILVAPAHTGSPSMVPSFAHAPFLAEEAKFIPSHLGEHSLGDLAATWICMLAEMPTNVGGVEAYPSDFVFAKTPTKEYTVSKIGAFLDDLESQTTGREFGPKFWPGVQEIFKDLQAPWAPTLIIYNSGFDTPSSYEYSTENLDAAAKCVKNEKGDGTITSGSICLVAEAWKQAGHAVELVEVPGKVNHKSLIVADATIAVVERAIKGGDLTPLLVTIVSAEDLINCDTFSKSDPYCICTLWNGEKEKKGSKQKTATITDDLNPTWDETFTIFSYEAGDSMVFEIWDEDPIKHDFIGKATLSEDLLRSGYDGTLDLEVTASKKQGKLKVKVVSGGFRRTNTLFAPTVE